MHQTSVYAGYLREPRRGAAFYYPAATSLLSDYHGRRTRSRALGVHQTSVYAGTIAGGFCAGLIAQHWGWRWSFLLFGGLGVVLGVVLHGYLREPRRGAAEAARQGRGQADEASGVQPAQDGALAADAVDQGAGEGGGQAVDPGERGAEQAQLDLAQVHLLLEQGEDGKIGQTGQAGLYRPAAVRATR
jgi:hypothetical protein